MPRIILIQEYENSKIRKNFIFKYKSHATTIQTLWIWPLKQVGVISTLGGKCEHDCDLWQIN